MNYQVTAAGGLVLLALLAHCFIGNKEALSARPAPSSPARSPGAERVELSWVQSMCAFQLVTVDLLLLAAGLLVLGVSDGFPGRSTLALFAAAYFALWGTAWLLQLIVLRRAGKDFLLLGQWILWYVCAGLLYWGAQA